MTKQELQKAIAYTKAEIQAGRLTPEHVVRLTEAWQASRGLKRDGECGPITRSSIDAGTPAIDTQERPKDDTSAGLSPICVVEHLGGNRYSVREET
jgi:hypothetical protein